MEDRQPALQPNLLPLLRSRLQADVATWVFLHPDQAHSVADIARHVHGPEVTVWRETNRLAAADLTVETRQGRNRTVSPNPANPATGPLTDLLAVCFGPVPVLRAALANIDGIDLALLHGSWARRGNGAPEPTPWRQR